MAVSKNNQCLKRLDVVSIKELESEIENLIFSGNHIDSVIRLMGFYKSSEWDGVYQTSWLIIYTPQRKGGIIKA